MSVAVLLCKPDTYWTFTGGHEAKAGTLDYKQPFLCLLDALIKSSVLVYWAARSQQVTGEKILKKIPSSTVSLIQICVCPDTKTTPDTTETSGKCSEGYGICSRPCSALLRVQSAGHSLEHAPLLWPRHRAERPPQRKTNVSPINFTKWSFGLNCIDWGNLDSCF